MKNKTVLFRILAVLLSLTLGVPGPVYALRAMTGEGTGLEELVSDLKKSNGQAEDLLRRADEIIALNRDRIRVGEEQSWEDFNALVNKAELLWQLPRPQPDDPQVIALDGLKLRVMEMLMLRHVPPQWAVGDPLPPEASADLYSVLSKGAVFVRQNPKPVEVLVRTARVHQATAMMFLASAGEMKDRASAHSVMVDPQVPWNESFGLLNELEMAEARKLQLQLNEIDDAENVETQELRERMGQHYDRALGYAFLRVLMIPRALRFSPSYEQSADALAVFLPNGLQVSEDVLRRRRQSILNAAALYVRSRGDEIPGQVPDNMVEEALWNRPGTLLEVASMAADLLSIVAENAGQRDSFRELARNIRGSLEEREPVYFRQLFGTRVRLQPPIPASEELMGVLAYDEASRRFRSEVRTLPTLYDLEDSAAPGAYFEIPPAGVIVPIGQYALQSDGLRVFPSESLTADMPPAARWYVNMTLKSGWTFPQPIWELHGQGPAHTGGADSLDIGPVSLRLIPGVGILVRSSPVGSAVYLEHVPAELRLDSLQQASLGHMIEQIIAQRNGSGEDWWVIAALQANQVYFKDAGVTLTRKPARLVEIKTVEEHPYVENRSLMSATLPEEGVEVDHLNGKRWMLRRQGSKFSLIAVDVPADEESHGEPEGTEEKREYRLTSGLSAVLTNGTWSRERLVSLTGPMEAGKSGRKVPIKITDGSRIRLLEFRVAPNGDLQIETEREPVLGLPETSRLLVRLAVFLANPAAGPVFGPETPIAELQAILNSRPIQTRSDYVSRFLAVTALAHHPDPSAVPVLLTRLENEPLPTIRQRIVTGLVERHLSGLRYSPNDRYKVWNKMGSLLMPKTTDPNRYVRRAVLQAYVRLTPDGPLLNELAPAVVPDGDPETLRKRIFDIAGFVLELVHGQDPDLDLRLEAMRYAGLLNEQFQVRSQKPIRVLLGPQETAATKNAGGLEEQAVRLPAAEAAMARFFYHPSLYVPDYAGVEETPLPADPAEARRFLLQQGIRPTELVILPESVPSGEESLWRPNQGPTIVLPAALLMELTPRHLAGLEELARRLAGQVLRIGLGEWRQELRDGVEYLSVQQ